MKKSRHPVTDHAIVRYLERVRGVDVDRLRGDVVTTVTLHNRPKIGTDRSGVKRGRHD